MLKRRLECKRWYLSLSKPLSLSAWLEYCAAWLAYAVLCRTTSADSNSEERRLKLIPLSSLPIQLIHQLLLVAYQQWMPSLRRSWTNQTLLTLTTVTIWWLNAAWLQGHPISSLCAVNSKALRRWMELCQLTLHSLQSTTGLEMLVYAAIDSAILFVN